MSCSYKSRFLGVRTLAKLSIAAVAIGVLCGRASAVPVTLTDGNAVATIDSLSGNVSYLSVGGVPQLTAQNYYYSLGGGAPQSFSTLDETSVVTGANASPTPLTNVLFLNYAGPGFTAQVGYTLAGGFGPTQSSELSSTVLIQQTQSQSPAPIKSAGDSLSVNVYQYDHLTLDDATNGRVAVNTGQDAVEQTEIGGRGASASVTPLGDEYEVGLTPTVFNSLTKPVTLNDTAGPYTGNVEFAMESDDANVTLLSPLNILSFDTFNPGVPVPPAIWMGLTTLVGIGGVGLVRRRAARA